MALAHARARHTDALSGLLRSARQRGLALLVCSALAGCGAPQQQDSAHEVTPSPSSAPGGGGQAGVSREEYCASGQPAITDVSAQNEGSTVIVNWRELFTSLDDRTFRIYRRSSPGAQWERIGELSLSTSDAGSYTDRSPLREPGAQYAVTQVGECGEGPICTGAGAAQQCSVTEAIRPRET